MTLGSRLKLLIKEVKDLISGQRQKEKEETAKKEKGASECPHHFGYLADRSKNESVPQECLICPKILECMHGENKSAFPNQKHIHYSPPHIVDPVELEGLSRRNKIPRI
jgi:hypothetical protein